MENVAFESTSIHATRRIISASTFDNEKLAISSLRLFVGSTSRSSRAVRQLRAAFLFQFPFQPQRISHDRYVTGTHRERGE